MIRLVLAAAMVCLICSFAGAQTTSEYYGNGYAYTPPPVVDQPWDYDFTISAGYTNIQFNHGANFPYSRDGAYVDADMKFHIPGLEAPLVGFGITGSGYWESYTSDFQSLYSDLGMVSFEGRIGFPLAFHKNRGFYLYPRLGAGPLLASSEIQYPFFTTYHNGVAFDLTPAVQVGYRFGNLATGLDLAYMFAWGGFGNYGSVAYEGRVGWFLSYRF